MFSTFKIIVVILFSQLNGENVIDVDDILSEDFMPSTLLVLENPKGSAKNFNETIKVEKKLDGSFNNAMSTMKFHRFKMNEYLCRSYIAEQIVNDMTLSRIKRRMGTNSIKPSKFSVKNEMLQDEGSSNYKDWLSKSITLEDVYRHYDKSEQKFDEGVDEDGVKNGETEEEYDSHITGYAYQAQGTGSPSKLGHSEGGYYHGGSYPHLGENFHVGSNGYPVSHGGHSGYGGHSYGGSGGGHSYNGNSHNGHDEEHIIHDVPKYHIFHEEHHSSKEQDLSDLFEIALTALAYLSFGMFIIHVIMCISMTNNDTTTTMASMMMPMSMSSTATGMGMSLPTGESTGDGVNTNEGSTGGGVESTVAGGSTGSGEAGMTDTDNDGTAGGDTQMDSEVDDGATGGDTESVGVEAFSDTIKFRLRRDIPIIINPNNQLLNELARRILTSIEAAFIANNDNGNCLRKSLCENNKYSRGVTGKNKILIPLWSLGMSWMSGRLTKKIQPAVSMLDSIKASILGLGDANCEIIYQNCDLRKNKMKQRKNRKKRNT